MNLYNWAAQGAPFFALVGYEDLVQDASDMLLNGKKRLFSDGAKQFLDTKLYILQKHLADQPVIEVIYYDESARTNGGLYCIITGILKKIEAHPSTLLLDHNIQIPCADILDICGQIFEKYPLV